MILKTASLSPNNQRSQSFLFLTTTQFIKFLLLSCLTFHCFLYVLHFLLLFVVLLSLSCLLLYHEQLFFMLTVTSLTSDLLDCLGLLLFELDTFSQVTFYLFGEFLFFLTEFVDNHSFLLIIHSGSQLFDLYRFIQINMVIFLLFFLLLFRWNNNVL